MKVLFLGAVTNELEVEKLSGRSIAGNKMQLNILRWLSTHKDLEISVISTLSIASFPKDKIYQKSSKSYLGSNLNALQVPFINVPIIKQISQSLSIFIFTFIHLLKNKDSVIFSFNIFPQQGIPLYLNSLIFKSRTITLLADLPIDDVTKRNILWKYLRIIFDSLTENLISRVDNLIVLNKNVIEYYNYKKRYLVIDGAINKDDFIADNNFKEKSFKNVVFTGALVEYNGIRELIEGFIGLNIEVTLDIYGSGYLQEEVINYSNQNSNIKYHGSVSNEEILNIQRNAWLLINPRDNENLISKLTFPSKLLEYMASGTAVLSTIIPGMDSIYLDYLYILDSNNPENIRAMIHKLYDLSHEELHSKGQKAKEYVLKNKNWEVVDKEIYKFVISL